MKYITRIIALILMGPISSTAFACSTCMVGDPTQSLMGAEKPFANRLRLSMDYLSRSEELGRDGFNKKIIDEQRVTTNLAWAPSRRWMFGLSVPYVKRQLETFNLADQDITALGDISLTVKSFRQDKESFQKHMYGFLGGIKLGTASEEKDANGQALDFDTQAGQGADVINVGLWYARFQYPYLVYTSASYHVASDGYQEFQAGDALVFNVTGQYAASQALAYYVGLEGRASEKDTFAGIEDEDSGGTIVFLTPGIIYTIKPDLLLNAVVKLPAIDNLHGDHEETTIFSIGLTYDFHIH